VSQALVVADKKLVSTYNARRPNDALKFAVEVKHLESIVRNSDQLQGCEPDSFGEVLLESAGVGLSLNPTLGHLYVVPYNKKDGGRRATVSVGYRGMVHLATSSGAVRNIQGGHVYARDTFRTWTDETGAHVHHEAFRGSRKERGALTHVYVLAWFPNGGHHLEVMDADQLKACEEAASKRNTKGGAVWRGPFRDTMELKAVIRRARKFWPTMTPELLRAFELEDEHDGPFPEEPGSREPEVTISDEDALKLHAMLTDHGLASEKATKWLERVARQHGITRIADLPASRLEKVTATLRGHLKTWKEKGGG